MLHGVIQQFFREVAWDNVDYLIVDLPPGTGDVALSLSQSRARSPGAVLVTTPQGVALADTRRAVRMYEKLNIPPLGLIENMSHFICPTCRTESDIFGKGGGEALAQGHERAVPRPHSDLRADPHRRRHRRSRSASASRSRRRRNRFRAAAEQLATQLSVAQLQAGEDGDSADASQVAVTAPA